MAHLVFNQSKLVFSKSVLRDKPDGLCFCSLSGSNTFVSCIGLHWLLSVGVGRLEKGETGFLRAGKRWTKWTLLSCNNLHQAQISGACSQSTYFHLAKQCPSLGPIFPPWSPWSMSEWSLVMPPLTSWYQICLWTYFENTRLLMQKPPNLWQYYNDNWPLINLGISWSRVLSIWDHWLKFSQFAGQLAKPMVNL